MSLSPLVITGVSQFSSDLQSIMDRAVKIAQLPIQQLQNRDSDAIQKKTILSGVSSSIDNLASSLEALSQAADAKGLAAQSSNSSVVTATASGATDPASYTINSVTTIAAAASERTSNHYADSAATPVGSTGNFRLVVGGQNYDFNLTNNTLVGLRDKINSLAAGVNASILTTSGGNYLSLAANFTGATTLSLQDDPTGANTNLLTNTNQGTDLLFHLNGIQVQQSRNLVNSVIPGLTLNFAAASTDPVNVTLSSDRSQLASGLTSFVAAYNAVRAQVTAQTGASAGLLTGSSLIVQLSSALRQLGSQRASSGGVRGLADLGVTFDNKGQLQFDPKQLNGLSDESVSDAFTFLGSSASGLGHYAAGLRQFTDPINGLIKLEQQGLDRVDLQLQSQISTLTDRISVMQKGLSLKLQQADALLAQLESQQKTVAASMQGLNVVLYGKNPG